MRTTRKTVIAVVSVVAVLALIATASFFAIFANRQKAETSIQTGKIDVKLVETFEGDDYDPDDPPHRTPDDDPYEGPGLSGAVKTVKGVNEGTQPAYVRVRIFPSIETQLPDGTWAVHGGIPVQRINYVHEYDGWVDGGDGYWYYTRILKPGEETSAMVIKELTVDLTEDEQAAYGEDILRVDVLIRLESTQASNELWKINWGIDKLPGAVEQ